MSSNESWELPVGQFIVSSQHAACQKRRHALLPISSQQLSPQLLVNTPPVFHQKWSSNTLSSTVVSQDPLQFLCQGFNLPVKGIAKVILLCYCTSPTSPPARGRSHPTVTAGVQHESLCLAFPTMQTTFACLYFGAVLKAFSPGQLRLWRSTSHTELSLVATPSSFPLQPGWCWTVSAHKGQRRVSHSVPMPNNWLKQGS